MTHKVLSFVQFPMKSGIFPVNPLSDAHLQKMKDFNKKETYNFFFYLSNHEMEETVYNVSKLCKFANVEGISPLTPALSM